MRKKKEIPPLPEGLVLGTNVRYYKDGWKIGLLDSWDGMAHILPMGGYAGKVHRHVTVSEADIEPIEKIMGQGGR